MASTPAPGVSLPVRVANTYARYDVGYKNYCRRLSQNENPQENLKGIHMSKASQWVALPIIYRGQRRPSIGHRTKAVCANATACNNKLRAGRVNPQWMHPRTSRTRSYKTAHKFVRRVAQQTVVGLLSFVGVNAYVHAQYRIYCPHSRSLSSTPSGIYSAA